MANRFLDFQQKCIQEGNTMTRKKKIKIVALAAAAILLLGSGLFTIVRVIEYNQTSVSL